MDLINVLSKNTSWCLIFKSTFYINIIKASKGKLCKALTVSALHIFIYIYFKYVCTILRRNARVCRRIVLLDTPYIPRKWRFQCFINIRLEIYRYAQGVRALGPQAKKGSRRSLVIFSLPSVNTLTKQNYDVWKNPGNSHRI